MAPRLPVVVCYNTAMTHTCIRLVCGEQYESADPEPYYCPNCVLRNKEIAAKVDAIIAARPKKPPGKSALQEYDEAQKVHGFVRAHL